MIDHRHILSFQSRPSSLRAVALAMPFGSERIGDVMGEDSQQPDLSVGYGLHVSTRVIGTGVVWASGIRRSTLRVLGLILLVNCRHWSFFSSQRAASAPTSV
jgi:hypothetical protein